MEFILALGIAGPVVFVLVFLIDGATRPGYIPMRHTISALSLGPRGWVQQANFVGAGALIAAGSVGLFLATDGIWLTVAVGLYGLALVGSGIFDMDPMRGFPPGTSKRDPKTFSTAHHLHDAAGAALFLVAMPAVAVLGALTIESTAWTAYSWATAVAVIVLTQIFSRGWERDSARSGLSQRAAVITSMAWLAGTSAFLLAGT